jgi:hypothetical protein
MNTENDFVPQCRYSKNAIKTILEGISEAQIAYDHRKATIDFDVAVKGLASRTYDDILSVVANFGDLKQLKEDVSEAEIISHTLQICYDTIEKLKYVPGYGGTYYKIINECYIKKRYRNVDGVAEALGVSRRTFYRRQNEAFEKLHILWFQMNPMYIYSVLNKMHTQLSH